MTSYSLLPRRVARKAVNFARVQRQRQLLARNGSTEGPPAVDPVWPLPRSPRGPSDAEIQASFDQYAQWHYSYKFEGGLEFSSRHARPTSLTDAPDRPLQRFRHFMPSLLEAAGGSLEGKTVLDIACNSGFWSLQCALLGARRVVGFDARPELVEEANLIKGVVGLENVEFRVLDFWKMTPENLGETFDVVLNLGVLYHLPKPVHALELTKAMSNSLVLLDTTVLPTNRPFVRVIWEGNTDIRNAAEAGIVQVPSRRSLEMMLKHLGYSGWNEIPLTTMDMPEDYLIGRRASWILSV